MLEKLSLLKLGRRVDVSSNKGKSRHCFEFNIGSIEVDHVKYKHREDALHHVGTRFTIRELKRSRVPKEIEEYRSRTLGLLLSDEFKVFANEIEVRSKSRWEDGSWITVKPVSILGFLPLTWTPSASDSP